MNINQNKVVDFGSDVEGYCKSCNFLSTNNKQVKFIQASYEQPSNSDNRTIENIAALGLTVLVIMGLVGLISWLQLWQIKKKLRNHLITDTSDNSPQNISQISQVSCYKCQYFHNNSYLKCAVNPSKVLRPEARDCSDYVCQPAENQKD